MNAILFVLIVILPLYLFLKLVAKNASKKNTYGWGSDFQKDFDLDKNEKNILNRITYVLKYDRFHHIPFCKKNLTELFINTIRKETKITKSDKEYRDIFEYCSYALKCKYDCLLPSEQEVMRLNRIMPDWRKQEIEMLCNGLLLLSDEDQSKLYSEDPTRWEKAYDSKVEHYTEGNDFYLFVVNLESKNSSVVVRRNIYHRAYRFVADKDRVVSLKLYLHYLSIVSDSDTFRHLNISAANQKKLFSTEKQKQNFNQLVDDFKSSADLTTALAKIDSVFKIKRREIKLDNDAIDSARNDLAGVVELLDVYLAEDELVAQRFVEKHNEPDNLLNETETEFFEFFILRSYQLTNEEVNTFANNKGLFRSQLVDKLNEQFYEQLDDLLIEEADDGVVLNEDYYKIITGT